jgi:transcriptional regulator PpsR
VSSRGAKHWNTGAIPLIAPDLLGDIIAAASDIALVIGPEGNVLSVLINPNHRMQGRLDHWVGTNLRDQLTSDSLPKLENQIAAFQAGTDSTRAIEMNHTEHSGWEYPVRYSFHRIGPDGAILMLGRDLRPIAEMQQQLVNAQLALEKDYEAQREFDTRFRVLMEATREALVFVAMASGRITEINRSAAKLMGSTRADLTGSAFAQEFEGRRRSEFMETMSGLALSDSCEPMEVQTRRTGERVRLVPTLFRASGERILLCRLESSTASDTSGDDLSENLNALYQEGVDAIVFTDRDGVITTANDSFLGMCDVAHASLVRGKSLGEFLSRGTVDLKVLLDNAARAGQMRMYATKLSSEYGSELSIELSATFLNTRSSPAYVFVIRDASRLEAVRGTTGPGSDGSVRSVMELVGSSSLKDIVAETTDVVEKMCIETAVELTRNNRVAAAEMLGLSRQSLYVKLRKYGLLNKADHS